MLLRAVTRAQSIVTGVNLNEQDYRAGWTTQKVERANLYLFMLLHELSDELTSHSSSLEAICIRWTREFGAMESFGLIPQIRDQLSRCINIVGIILDDIIDIEQARRQVADLLVRLAVDAHYPPTTAISSDDCKRLYACVRQFQGLLYQDPIDTELFYSTYAEWESLIASLDIDMASVAEEVESMYIPKSTMPVSNRLDHMLVEFQSSLFEIEKHFCAYDPDVYA